MVRTETGDTIDSQDKSWGAHPRAGGLTPEQKGQKNLSSADNCLQFAVSHVLAISRDSLIGIIVIGDVL